MFKLFFHLYLENVESNNLSDQHHNDDEKDDDVEKIET